MKTIINFILVVTPGLGQGNSESTILKNNVMNDQNFSATILVEQSPEEVFNAINNVRGWWSEEIEGPTDKLNAEWTYHYKDVHRCKMKIVEFIPGEKVAWLVLDNYFNFTKDKSEWIGTKIIFEISGKGNKTQLVFTHSGLVPQYECYEVCQEAWSNYINNSLRKLIATGKGQPNPREGEGYNSRLAEKWGLTTMEKSYTNTLLVNQSPEEVFDAITNVRGWWTEEVTGSFRKPGDEFEVRFGDVHYSRQKLTEVIPGKRVVWLVTDSKLSFLQNKSEWTGTEIRFEISRHDDQTQLRFTHQGLVPEYECFDVCSDTWTGYLQNSLASLISTGKGQPAPKKIRQE